MSPRDPQGAETRTTIEWQNIYQRLDGSEFTPSSQLLDVCRTRAECDAIHETASDRWKTHYKRVAVEETTTTISRIPCAGEEQ